MIAASAFIFPIPNVSKATLISLDFMRRVIRITYLKNDVFVKQFQARCGIKFFFQDFNYENKQLNILSQDFQDFVWLCLTQRGFYNKQLNILPYDCNVNFITLKARGPLYSAMIKKAPLIFINPCAYKSSKSMDLIMNLLILREKTNDWDRF